MFVINIVWKYACNRKTLLNNSKVVKCNLPTDKHFLKHMFMLSRSQVNIPETKSTVLDKYSKTQIVKKIQLFYNCGKICSR